MESALLRSIIRRNSACCWSSYRPSNSSMTPMEINQSLPRRRMIVETSSASSSMSERSNSSILDSRFLTLSRRWILSTPSLEFYGRLAKLQRGVIRQYLDNKRCLSTSKSKLLLCLILEKSSDRVRAMFQKRSTMLSRSLESVVVLISRISSMSFRMPKHCWPIIKSQGPNLRLRWTIWRANT